MAERAVFGIVLTMPEAAVSERIAAARERLAETGVIDWFEVWCVGPRQNDDFTRGLLEVVPDAVLYWVEPTRNWSERLCDALVGLAREPSRDLALAVDLTDAPRAAVLAAFAANLCLRMDGLGDRSTNGLALVGETDEGEWEALGAYVELGIAAHVGVIGGTLTPLAAALVRQPLPSNADPSALADAIRRLDAALEWHQVSLVPPRARDVVEAIDVFWSAQPDVSPMLVRALDGLRSEIASWMLTPNGDAFGDAPLLAALVERLRHSRRGASALLMLAEALLAGYGKLHARAYPARHSADRKAPRPAVDGIRRGALMPLKQSFADLYQLGEKVQARWHALSGIRNTIAHCGRDRSPDKVMEFADGFAAGREPPDELYSMLAEIEPSLATATATTAVLWRARILVFLGRQILAERMLHLTDAARAFVEQEGGEVAELEVRIIDRRLIDDGPVVDVEHARRMRDDTLALTRLESSASRGAPLEYWVVDGDPCEVAAFTGLVTFAAREPHELLLPTTDRDGVVHLRAWNDLLAQGEHHHHQRRNA